MVRFLAWTLFLSPVSEPMETFNLQECHVIISQEFRNVGSGSLFLLINQLRGSSWVFTIHKLQSHALWEDRVYQTWPALAHGSNSSWGGRTCEEFPAHSGAPVGSHMISKESRDRRTLVWMGSWGITDKVGLWVHIRRRQYLGGWRTQGRCSCGGHLWCGGGAFILISECKGGDTSPVLQVAAGQFYLNRCP